MKIVNQMTDPTLIRLDRFNLAILKNLKRAGLPKEDCIVRFNEQFVNQNWERV